MSWYGRYPELAPAEAAAVIKHADFVGCSGFTNAAGPKAVGLALADRANAEHAGGRPFRISLISGASAGPALDDVLAKADAFAWRAPFQTSGPLREAINAERVEFADLHLSQISGMLENGVLGTLDVGIVEATHITDDGRVSLTTSGGISRSVLAKARKVIIEINQAQHPALADLHDVCSEAHAVQSLHDPLGRIGERWAMVDPARVVGVVKTNQPDTIPAFEAASDAIRMIGQHIAEFLANERAAGRMPSDPVVIQAGVGNVSNGVIAALGADESLPPFVMYTEVIQDSQAELMERGRIAGASTTGLMLSNPMMRRVFDRMDYFGSRIVIRPQDVSNCPALVERFNVIAINTALEIDIYGHVNSTHVCGTKLINGIGGSADFTRNARLSIMMAPSVAKNGAISAIVPMATHIDHSEHSVDVVVTDQGVADLRGLGPRQRRERIIEHCAHPAYKDYLRAYVAACSPAHVRHDLDRCFELHHNFLRTGRMLPEVRL